MPICCPRALPPVMPIEQGHPNFNECDIYRDPRHWCRLHYRGTGLETVSRNRLTIAVLVLYLLLCPLKRAVQTSTNVTFTVTHVTGAVCIIEVLDSRQFPGTG